MGVADGVTDGAIEDVDRWTRWRAICPGLAFLICPQILLSSMAVTDV